MYSALADAEFLCGLPHRGPVLDDVGGQLTGALLDVSLQDPTHSLSRYGQSICVEEGNDTVRGKYTR